MASSFRRRVSYFYDHDVGNFYYAQGHPMKPHRVRMTHNLLVAYGLADYMNVLKTPHATEKDMTRFHGDEYISFLKTITPDASCGRQNISRFNVLEDCPVFDGLWEYCQIAAGGSLAGAARLNSGEADVAMNWAGGLHHAKKVEASGFCYINDCVLAILELLKVHARVLYVDIDIHHGDGVEEAFYCTDRVMTASFHKFGDFFPGTGDVGDIGHGKGKHYSVNFPLLDGIDDESYREVFVPVMTRVMEWFQPGAVLLQCGADSLAGDRLGCFNLSLRGHGQCVDFFRKYDVPLLLLGGGGYTIRNVSRCWAYETSRVLNIDLPDKIPHHDNYEFHGPDFRLHIQPSNMENHNTRTSLERTKVKLFESLRVLPHAPSVPFRDVPRALPLGVDTHDEDSDLEYPDVRKHSKSAQRVVEYEDSDDELGDNEYVGGLAVARRRFKKSNFSNHDLWKPLPASAVPIPEGDGRLSPVRNARESSKSFKTLPLPSKKSLTDVHMPIAAKSKQLPPSAVTGESRGLAPPIKKPLVSDMSPKEVKNTAGRSSPRDTPRKPRKGDERIPNSHLDEVVLQSSVGEAGSVTKKIDPKEPKVMIKSERLKEESSVLGSKRPRSMSMEKEPTNQSLTDWPPTHAVKKSKPAPHPQRHVNSNTENDIDGKDQLRKSEKGRVDYEGENEDSVRMQERHTQEKKVVLSEDKRSQENANTEHKSGGFNEKKIAANGQVTDH